MQEYSTVTASSYDAESLAPLLTEKAAEGWDVVSIVAAGTNIVAYLRREGDAAAAPTGSDVAAAATAAAAATVDDAQAPADSTVSAGETEAAAPAEAADEPAGWAAAPENDITESAGADDATAAVAAAGVGAEAAGTLDTSADPAAGATDQPGAAADPATDAAAAAGVGAATADSGVPAGWYADPSGRYELRYWDGSAWTEHVSRAGQQFTDPPVA